MPQHSSLELLEPAFQVQARRFLSEVEKDPTVKAFGIVKLIPTETLRDLSVQMAYRARLLYVDLGSPKELKPVIANYVREMFKAAGLWTPTEDECITPNTKTLQSRHLVGKAMDFMPTLDGKTRWRACPEDAFYAIAEVAHRCGLVSGCDWFDRVKRTGFYDPCHVEAK